MRIEQFNNVAFNDVVLALQPSARRLPPADFNEWLLALLRPHVAFDTAIIGMGRVDDDGCATVNAVHLHRLPQAMMLDYEAVRDRDPVARASSACIGATANVCVGDEPMDQQLKQFIEEYGLRNALCTAIEQPRIGMSLYLTLARGDYARRFTETERALKESWMPHIAEAIITNRYVNLLRAHSLSAEVDRLRALVDRNGVVHEADEGWVELIQREWPGFDGKQIPATMREVVSKHVECIAWDQVHCDFVATGDFIFVSSRPTFGHDRLTSREFEVARLFAAGASHKHIARPLGIAPSTVRRHLQTVYRKLGIKTKVALAQLMSKS